MSPTRNTSTASAEEVTVGSSTAPVTRVGRRLKIAARVLADIGAPVTKASLVHVVRGGAPDVRAVGEKVCVGRGAAATWQIEDAALSRQHFEIVEDEWGVVLRDLKSHNGTRVNEAACTERRLADGDLIHAGAQLFLFLAGEGGEA